MTVEIVELDCNNVGDFKNGDNIGHNAALWAAEDAIQSQRRHEFHETPGL